MEWKFQAIKTICDPLERARRLAALYGPFEKTAAVGMPAKTEPTATVDAQPDKPAEHVINSTVRAKVQTGGAV